MNKKGFTLVELLVVIAIIAILSIVVIPSVITVNKNINERMYTQKVENIEASAELYGSNNEDLFNGTDEVTVYVYELVANNYMTTDVKVGDSNCSTAEAGGTGIKGCVIDPVTKTSMNGYQVVIKKQNIGVVATYIGGDHTPSPTPTSELTLTEAVCRGLQDQSKFVGKYGTGENDICECNANRTGLVNKDGQAISATACLISGGTVNNNYLKYGSSKPNWRVLGVYVIDGQLTPKIITSDPV